MNIVDIMRMVGKSEDAGDIGITLKVHRKCSGRKAKIVPGLLADVVRWGNEGDPSIVFLRNTVVREWAARSKHAMLRTWASFRDRAARDQSLKLVENTFGEPA